MNATAKKAGTLREYLMSNNPELWDQVIKNDLGAAACWNWPAEKVRRLHFKAFHRNEISPDNGMLDLPGADLGDMPWAGLPPERMIRWGSSSCASAKCDEEVELAYWLNQSLAGWLGRSYSWRTSHEASFCDSILMEKAAQAGDAKRVPEIFSAFGDEGLAKWFVAALRTAAHRNHRDFVKALCEQIPAVVEEAYAQCEPDKVTPEDKEAFLIMREVGIPVPAKYEVRATLWLGEALIQRGRKGVLPQTPARP